ncbi:MAG: WD40 repeat domain-containing protein [Luteolibacter sp.]
MNIRIFFSSPGDVKMERETAKRIVDRLQSEVGGDATIEPYFWEHEVMVATKDYQENIPHMDDFDIVVCILWSRLGTPLDPARHPRPDGGGFASGTEYEFVTAMQAHELKGTPDIFVFRNTTEPRRPSRPKEVREAVDKEIDRLDNFFDEYFQDDTFFTRAINIYSTLGEFEEKLTIALRSYITGRIPSSPSKQGKNKPTYHRQPYLGLAAFDYDDAPVFFGRTAQIGDIITAFQTQEMEAAASTDAPPKHFVLILGSSGSGKSSLARAGVMPMLSNPGVIEGANSWRIAMFKPADVPGDPILALVQSLNTERGLPELFADGTTPKEIADLIRTQPEGGGLLLRQALTQAGAQALTKRRHELTDKLDLLKAENREDDADEMRKTIDALQPPAVRIALLADQLEELFTSDLSPEALETFIGILVALANSGRIYVLATLRSDFYPRCLEHPSLIALMQGSGTYGLPAPSAADIGQMIRQPASIAGLTFEENPVSGENLDELLRDEALKDPAALPLLSYTLEQLYEQRTEEDLLTLQAYRDLGGLEGAIGSRAETIFTALPNNAQAAFDPLCKQLVTLQEGGQPTRRRASYTTLTRSPESKTLVDALVDARLLTADQSPSGERIVSVAHEALLRHWPRLVSWVEENRLFLNTRTRVASRLADWMEHEKSDDYLIPRGPNLSAAESILAGHLSSLDPLEIEFIGKSIDRVRQADQKKLRTARMITAGAVVLCLIAVAGGLVALREKKSAQKERNAAIAQEKLANAATREALSSKARSSYTVGIEQLEAGKDHSGLKLLAQTLAVNPTHKGALTRLYSELLYSTPRPIPIRSVVSSSQMRQRISGSQTENSQYITYIAPDKSPEVFDLRKMEVVSGPWSEGRKTVAPALTHNSEFLLDVQADGDQYAIRCWNIRQKTAGATITVEPKGFLSLLVSTDGKYLCVAYSDGAVKLISTKTGEPEHEWTQSGNTAFFSEVPGKFLICTYTNEIVIHDLVNHTEKRIPKQDGFDFYDAKPCVDTDTFVIQAFRMEGSDGVTNHFTFVDANTAEPVPDSRIIEVKDGVWDYMPNRAGNSVAVAVIQKGPRTYHAFHEKADRVFSDKFAAVRVSISPDGRNLVSSTDSGTVNILDIKTTEPAFAPIHHETKLEDLGITWNGRYLLSSSGTTATIWDLSVGTGLSLPVSFEGTPSLVNVTGSRITVQTKETIHRFDVATLTKEPVTTRLSFIGPIFNERITRSAAKLDGGAVKILGSAPGEAAETVVSQWQCPENELADWVGFSPDGSIFAATLGTKGWIVESDTAKTRSEYSMPQEPGAYPPAITADNRFLIQLMPQDELSYEYKVFGRDLANSEDLVFRFADENHNQLRRAYPVLSPDSRWLAIASESTGGSSLPVTFVWDLHDLAKPAMELPNAGQIYDIQFSQDGEFICIGTTNNVIEIRSLTTGNLIGPSIHPPGEGLLWFTVSPQSATVAVATVSSTVSAESENKPSSLTVFDLKEAIPVTKTFRVPTSISRLAFTPDGRSLFATFPTKSDPNFSILQGWEIAPPPEIAAHLFPLAEAATALHIENNKLPKPMNPFDAWQTFRTASPDSWFLLPPENRSISPSFDVPTMRWIKDELVEIDALFAAMPGVPLANAAIAHWRQSYFNKLTASLSDIEEGTPEHTAQSEKIDDLADTIGCLRTIAERNPDAHPLIPYYLALQAQAEGNDYRYKKYSLLAYKRNPEDAECAALAAKIYEDASRYDQVLPILQKIRELAPEDMNYRFRLGTALWQLGKKSEAQAEFAAALADGSLPDAEQAIALIYMGRGSDALPLFKSLADTQKESSGTESYSLDSLVYLIAGHLHNNDQTTAIATYRQLIAQAPAAADMATVESVGLHPLLTTSLIETLKLTLAAHPDLDPANNSTTE